jgi:hypothetical protein
MRRTTLAASSALVCVLVAVAGCGSKPSTVVDPTASGTLAVGSAAPTTPAATPAKTTGGTSGGGTSGGGSSDWPSPEDCVSYNPTNVTVHYEAGIFQVNDGTKVVMRLHGDPSSNVGQQGLALAQRYARHCYLGRNNTRTQDRAAYIFDYWRDPTGKSTTIPDEADACSDYNRNNLTVENMGGADGWRVKDHDHVLHLFDNGSDANNGKLVIAKYSHICTIGGDDNQDYTSYFK